MEITSLTSTITNLKTQNMTLENNLNSMKQTNKQTIDFQSEQLTNVQDRLKSEKEKLLKDSQEVTKLKNDTVELKKKNYRQFQMQKMKVIKNMKMKNVTMKI